MTTPVPPEGKFVTVDEAIARYEGDFPSERMDWLQWRIFDVENALMGLVPSLQKPVEDIESESDQGRLNRVQSLVIEKVLGFYRNPTGVQQYTVTVDDVTESRSYSRGTSAGIMFSEDELNSVRLRKRRPKIGSIDVEPWRLTC